MTACPWCVGPHDLPADPRHPLRVSVVVCHYEQPDDLARTLAALERQDAPVHEVVVTDDGSRDPPAVGPRVRLLTQPDRGFRAALARNRGVAATTGDVVVVLDADTAPEPAAVRLLAEAVAAEPDVLAVGHRRHTRFGPAGPDPLAGAREHELAEPAWLRDGWEASDDLRRADDGSYRHVISAVAAFGRGWFDRVGGFDETLVGYGGEDWELAHRWWTAGGRLRHVPDAVAWHRGEHAGDGDRAAADSSERRTAETMAVASRVAAWPSGFRGLRVAPPRVVLTHGDGIDDRGLVVAVDGLLAADPAVEVWSDRAVWASLGDPRVRPVEGAEGHRAAVRVHLHRGVAAEPDAWRRLLARVDDAAVHRRLVDAEGPVLTLSRLRLLRRAHLGLDRPSTGVEARGEARVEALPPDVRAVGSTTLAAWLGGWAG